MTCKKNVANEIKCCIMLTLIDHNVNHNVNHDVNKKL